MIDMTAVLFISLDTETTYSIKWYRCKDLLRTSN